MQNPPPVQTAKSSTGLDENVAALLSYIFGWVSGLVFFLIEKRQPPGPISCDAVAFCSSAAAAVVGIVLWFGWIILQSCEQ